MSDAITVTPEEASFISKMDERRQRLVAEVGELELSYHEQREKLTRDIHAATVAKMHVISVIAESYKVPSGWFWSEKDQAFVARAE